MTVLAVVVLGACGSPGTSGQVGPVSPSPTLPSTAPAGATGAVYFSVAAGADPVGVAARVMGRPVFIERAPTGGANPGDVTGPIRSTVFLMPVAPGGESAALARFQASKDVVSASLGRYPPLLPS